MDFDTKRLTQADDDSLKEAVRQAALAAGAGELRARALTSDMDKLKKTLSALTQSDLQGIADAVGEDRLKEILSKLGN